MPIQTIAVIGAGTAGRAFALRCAQAGFRVTLEDVMPHKLRRAQDEYATFGQLPLRYALTVEEAVHDADLAVDFVPDELESKLEIWALLDRMAPPRTVLFTPTTTLSITDLASCTYRAPRCVGVAASGKDVLTGPVTLLRSRFADPVILNEVAAVFTKLSLSTVVVDDIEQPQLVKNSIF